ncbi:MAG: VOC family protein [Hyphomonadaceae bacterium]
MKRARHEDNGMTKSIFVNLPVKDLKTSMAFFAALGWTHNPQFTDETAASIVISDTIYAMLLTHDKYRQFTDKQIADATKTSEVLIALSVDTPEEMARICDAALANGGSEPKPPQDYGFMKSRTFSDPDDHHWEVVWMDPAGMPQQA